MNTADFTLTSTVVAAALGLALGLMAAPAGAHHNLGHMKGGPGGDGGGEIPTIVTTEAQWTGGIAELAARPCVAAQVKPNGDYGTYVCEQQPPVPANQVTYNLGVGVQTARKGDADLCNLFDGINLTPNEKYLYNWVDNCGDGFCSILIITWFDGEEVITATGEKADRINYARGTPLDYAPGVDSRRILDDQYTVGGQRIDCPLARPAVARGRPAVSRIENVRPGEARSADRMGSSDGRTAAFR